MPAVLTETDSYDSSVSGPAAGDARTASSVRQMGSPLASRTRWLYNRISDVIGSFLPLSGAAPVEVTVDASTDVITSTAHGLSNGDPVRFFAIGSGAAVPGALNALSVYYVVSATTDTFKVATTSGGSAINITSTGTHVFVAKQAAQSWYEVAVSSTFSAAGSFIAGASAVVAAVSFYPSGGIIRSGASARYKERDTVLLSDADHSLDCGQGDNFAITTPTAQRTLTLLESTGTTPQEGETITVTRPSTGAFAVLVKREGSAAAVVTLPNSTRSSAVFKYIDLNDGNGLHWRLISTESGTPGANA